MRPPRLIAAILVVGSLLLAGCGGDESPSSPTSDESKAQVAAAADQAPDTWPLTGLAVTGNGSAAQSHPVIVLKLDNTASSAPQVGLGEADLVVEELVEGGVTRLAAFYYSKIPGDVGPVRSMRASDIGIVKPVDAAIVTSGAAPVTLSRITGAGISYFTEGAKGFYREDSRSAPYNLFTNLKDTASLVQGDTVRPADYLPWGKPADLPKGQPATAISAIFSAGRTTSWTFRDGGYINENTYAAEGDEFPADTVLVLRVKVGDAGYLDPAKNPVPETIFEGSGDALLFHDGRLVRGTWSKKSLEAPIALKTQAGKLTVPTGRTFIELVPQPGGDVTFTK